MKQIGLLALALISITPLCSAAQCPDATLETYESLGAAGCTLGTNQLYDFQVLPILSGPEFTSIDPNEVSLLPLRETLNPGIEAVLHILTSVQLESVFTYRMSGNTYTSSTIVQSQSGVGGYPDHDGVVFFGQYICADGVFGPNGTSNCTGTLGVLNTLVTSEIPSSRSASTPLNPTKMLSVTDDIIFDPGRGYSDGGVFSNQFAAPDAVPAPTPEPLTFLLTAAGLAIAFAFKRRASNQS